MSRIGEKPVVVNKETQVEIKDQSVSIRGREGVLSIAIPKGITVALENNTLIVRRLSDDKRTKSQHGLIRTLINNALLGVNKLWEKRLQLVGTGFRVKLQGEDLIFEVGYSHPVVFKKAAGINFAVEGSSKLMIQGVNKQLVGEVAQRIKRIKKPDPYKGKGIRYEGEQLKLRPGKKAKTTASPTK